MRTITIIYYLMLCMLGMYAQKAGTVITAPHDVDAYFTQQPITQEVMERMRGRSLPHGKEAWARRHLCYLRVIHRNAEGRTQVGELVCNKAIAGRLLHVMRSLYDEGYRIERMVLIDEYGADDNRSMRANNTSCFNYRTVSGTQTLSMHGRGLAIDINPLYNPWVRGNRVDPAEGRPYAFDRMRVKAKLPVITTADGCYRLFIKQGFRWGGAWRSSKDYQHFEFRM